MASTYARTIGSGTASTTTVPDPQSNVTVIQCQGNYEAGRQVYQGAAVAANLLQTATTCYNGNTTNCPGTAVPLPITERALTSAKITDLIFGYTATGQVSDLFESTPTSGGYYHAIYQY